jgi:hypothetical protein
MVFLVITHCEELRYYGDFHGPLAQAHREEIRRDTFAAMGTVNEAMAAVFERMPTFFVQCPWPKAGFHPSQVGGLPSGNACLSQELCLLPSEWVQAELECAGIHLSGPLPIPDRQLRRVAVRNTLGR